MLKLYGIALILAACTLSTAYAQALNERNGIINATFLQNLREFPHQVGIYVDGTYPNYCSGNILTNNWILTAHTCVGYDANAQLTIMFNRLNISINSTTGNSSYSVQIGMNQVHTIQNANLALIHLPVALQFDINVAPVALAIDANEFHNGKRAVMAGVGQNTTLEAYGQFEIIANCNNTYPDHDSAQEVCTLGWHNSTAVPCSQAQGGGLLVDWPAAPRLIGIFSSPQSCLSYIPARYYKVAHYLRAIEEVIGQHIKNSGYFV